MKSADDQRLEDIKTLLNKCPTGAATVKYLETEKIPVAFAAGGGSYWDGKKIVIDRSQPVELASLTVVHEVHHAKTDRQGHGANVTTESRKNYVEKKLEEESAGTVKSIQAKNELVAKGEKITSVFPLESEYNDGYRHAVDQHRKLSPKATNHELAEEGRKAGHNAVKKGFEDGSVVTSNTNAPYGQYYGQNWDANQAHLKKPGPVAESAVPNAPPQRHNQSVFPGSSPPPPRRHSSAEESGPSAPPPRKPQTPPDPNQPSSSSTHRPSVPLPGNPSPRPK